MDDRYKRLNRETGKPFYPGYKDENGRFFLRYLEKQGNDYLFQLPKWNSETFD